MKDPVLEEHASLSSEGLEYSFVGIPQSVIETVDACVQLIWVLGGYGKTIRPEKIIHNVQRVFVSDEVKTQNIHWKEHCAGSLRELVDNHFEANCLRFLKSVAKRSASEDERIICEKIGSYKEFLNDFAHFRSRAIQKAQGLLNQPSLQEISESDFDKVCTDFIMHLDDFFKHKAR